MSTATPSQEQPLETGVSARKRRSQNMGTVLQFPKYSFVRVKISSMALGTFTVQLQGNRFDVASAGPLVTSQPSVNPLRVLSTGIHRLWDRPCGAQRTWRGLEHRSRPSLLRG